MNRKNNPIISTSFAESIAKKSEAKYDLNGTNFNENQNDPQDFEKVSGPISLMEGIIDDKIKVLLLEDNKINQLLAVEMMAMLGIHLVDVVENGYEGLQKAMATQYDLIVTDIRMPIMDGIEFTQEIRKKNQYKTVPIIALTANVQEEQVKVYYSVGMNNCLMKPVNITDLQKVLELYLVS